MPKLEQKQRVAGKWIHAKKEKLYQEIDEKVDDLPEELIINLGKEFWDEIPGYIGRADNSTAKIPGEFERMRKQISERFGISEDLTTGIINRYLKIYAVQCDEPFVKKQIEKGYDRVKIYGSCWGDLGRAMLLGRMTNHIWSTDLVEELREIERKVIEERKEKTRKLREKQNENKGNN